MSTKAIFTPIKIGNHLLKHRVVLAPLTRFRADPEAVPTDLQVEYYKQRASEGGLLITEATFIDRLAGGYPRAPGIYNKSQISEWKKVTEAVHSKGGLIYCQLWHIGRAGSKYLNPNQEEVVSASSVAITGKNMAGGDYEVPHALEIDEIKAIIEQYRQAALNAIEAGFDGVEVHSANGYLLDQFINTSSNKRTDIYGGSIENRTRFSLEALEAIVQAVGAERTAIRFSPGGAFQDMADETVVDTWSHLTSEIQKKHPNLAYLHFIEARANIHGDGASTADSLEPYRQIWKGPFIASSGFSTATEHAIDVAEKTGNLIAFGRSFIANPDLPERLRNGWELNKYNRNTFYTNDAEGYTDYPFYDAKN
jgi:2,4-dienoyl-CoA reductase-like NADH-dependent reductase (Old Yellow Enzyme family)